MKEELWFERTVRDERFPQALFLFYLAILLVMSGLHTGIIVLMSAYGWSELAMTIAPIVYWTLVATGITIYTRRQVRRIYEEPMQRLAEATRQVASGDFSVYIAPVHTIEKLDYLDNMIIDFNKMVEELGSIETLKTDFTANVSHEIKTPLAIIQNNAELLRLEPLTERQQEYADTIYHTAHRLADLITNILKLNRLEKQTITPESHPYDVCAQLAECALNYEDVWERKGLEFDADIEDHAEIIADPALMELVWNNLLSNAVKFTESGGSINLTQHSDASYVYVSVSDTGCGMSEETRAHIFEKFYQGDTSHATAGNGLGLALAMRVLQLSGFEIHVESAPGEGSTFTVVMPRTQQGEPITHE